MSTYGVPMSLMKFAVISHLKGYLNSRSNESVNYLAVFLFNFVLLKDNSYMRQLIKVWETNLT